MVKPGYQETEIGIIPEEWEVSRLKDAFVKIEAGVSVNSNDDDVSDYFVLKTSAVHDGTVDIREKKPVVSADYSRLKCPLSKDSIIISRMNTPALVGECGYNSTLDKTVFLPDRLWQIRNPENSDYNFIWLNYLLNTTQYRDKVRSTATGTSNSMKNISKERLLEILIPKPDACEQQKIATALSDMDSLIASLEKLIAKKQVIKQGAMQELLTGKKRLPGCKSEWAQSRLKRLCNICRGGSPRPIQNYLTNDSKGVNWIKIGDVSPDAKYITSTKEKIKENGVSMSRRVYKGDFILSNSMSFGRPYILKIDGCIHDGWLAIQDYQEWFDTDFLYYLLGADYVLEQYIQMAAGSSVKNLNKEKVSNIKVSFPDRSEQQAIASILSDMDSEITALEQKLAKYRQIKQGMMQQLLTGKIRLV